MEDQPGEDDVFLENVDEPDGDGVVRPSRPL